jgi:hypothetical protein
MEERQISRNTAENHGIAVLRPPNSAMARVWRRS